MENEEKSPIPRESVIAQPPPSNLEDNPQIREGTLKDAVGEHLGMRQFMTGVLRRLKGVKSVGGMTPNRFARKVDRIIEETKDK